MRKNLSKTLRFEIFKRDGFSCQYCGRTPPQVVLVVDHVLAVVNGGNNDEDNLLTSCVDCNQGKAARKMDRVLAPVNLNIEERAEKLEQLKAFSEQKLKEYEFIEDQVNQVLEHWASLEGQDVKAETYWYDTRMQSSVRRFLKQLSCPEILDAVNITFSKCDADKYQKARYFYAVCWHKIRKDIPECT